MVLWWLYGGYVFQVVVKAEILNFWVKFDLEGLSLFLNYNSEHMNDTEQPWWQENIGSGHGLMQSGNAPWPGPMMTQVFVTI